MSGLVPPPAPGLPGMGPAGVWCGMHGRGIWEGGVRWGFSGLKSLNAWLAVCNLEALGTCGACTGMAYCITSWLCYRVHTLTV